MYSIKHQHLYYSSDTEIQYNKSRSLLREKYTVLSNIVLGIINLHAKLDEYVASKEYVNFHFNTL